jgi:membrane-bound metal-dependent hydrolase YbcI (DUF457 family)
MSETKNRMAAVLVVVLTNLCLASFLIPAFIIRPFRYQSPRALSLAIAMKGIAPSLAAAGFVVLLIVALMVWNSASNKARAGLAIAVLLSAASATMTRLNYFEWMFRPIQRPGFVSAADAHLADEEMVMAVKLGQEARAYPIQQMAYHHVLNDTVAGVPIAVTY